VSQFLKPSAAPAGRFASLRRLFGRAAPPPARPRPRTRLGLERLEAREVPAVFMVTNLNDSGPGSLRDAIHQVQALPPGSDRSFIDFAPNLAGQTINLISADIDHGAAGNSSALEVVNALTIQGTGETINRPAGAGAFRLFDVEPTADFQLYNLTLSGGLATGDSTVGGSAEGGAIVNNGGTLYLNGCTLTNDQAFGGNGLAPNNDGGYAYGGAISNEDGKLSLINCTLTNNVAAGGSADPGGGTTGSAEGGAVYTFGSDGYLAVVHSTIAGNVVSGDTTSPQASNGGAVYTYRGQVNLINSILSGTFDGLSDVCNNTGNVVTSGTGVANVIPTEIYTFHGGTTDTSGVIQADPMLGPLQDNGGPTQTMALLPGSPALAQVPVYGAVTTDQRGAARSPGMTDIGAYEVQNPLSPVGVPTDPGTLFGPHPNGSADEAFVKGLYQATLLRAPDPGGLTFWLGQLSAGVSHAAVAEGFYNSTENRTNETTFFYREFLGREPDAGGLTYWVGVLQSGVDEAQVMKDFLLSPEYSAKNGNDQFVSTLYYAILGRQGDAGGFAFWKNELDTNQLSRDQEADAFIRSVEGINRVVANDYAVYLKRTAAPSDLALWLGPVQSGLSFGSVATACLGSQEFYNDAAANVP
jgi:hypothetical protein